MHRPICRTTTAWSDGAARRLVHGNVLGLDTSFVIKYIFPTKNTSPLPLDRACGNLETGKPQHLDFSTFQTGLRRIVVKILEEQLVRQQAWPGKQGASGPISNAGCSQKFMLPPPPLVETFETHRSGEPRLGSNDCRSSFTARPQKSFSRVFEANNNNAP